MKNLPIGLFDSGMGGLTVMREIADLLPNENLIYFGDTARLPYGNKSPQAIVQYSLENAKFLLKQNIKLLIIACHTACSHACSALQKELPIPVIGVTNPGVESLIQATKNKQVAVLGTSATVNSGMFQSLLRSAQIETHAIACPLFVPLVEEGLQNHPAAKLIAEHYLNSLNATEIDAVLLACTHYPLLKSVIQEVLKPGVQIIEPAHLTAKSARQLLEDLQLLNPTQLSPSYKFYVSDAPEKFRHLGKLFFPYLIDQVDFSL